MHADLLCLLLCSWNDEASYSIVQYSTFWLLLLGRYGVVTVCIIDTCGDHAIRRWPRLYLGCLGMEFRVLYGCLFACHPRR